jgi:hypothetical protein
MKASREVALLLMLSAMSALGVIISLLDIGEVVSGPRRIEVALTSFLVFIAVIGRAFYRERKELYDLKSFLAPKVQIVFEEGGRRPYLQRTLLRLSEDVGGEEWRYRIGVRNLGRTEIPRARAILEHVEPIGEEGFRRVAENHIYPGQPLQAMGKAQNTDEFLLGVSGEEPSVYVDVAYDHLTEEGATKMICFAYATSDMPATAVAGAYRVTIRVEGAGTFDRRTFIVDRDDAKHLRMRAE